jgi:hypothetical protein
MDYAMSMSSPGVGKSHAAKALALLAATQVRRQESAAQRIC